MSNNLTIKEVLTRGVAEVLPSRSGLEKLMNKRKIRLYLGIDPTGSELHLGHSVVLRKLNQFALLGHQVILLIGNGTVKIGDPTGRDESRPMLTDLEIEANFKTWKKQASKVLDFSKIEIRRNGDWLDKLTMVDVIKLTAKTTVQQLIERDMFQERIKKGQPIHGHEILYPLLQGYDSVEMDVDLELGGTDQTFNMMMGRTLQKIYHNKEKWVLTTPIINGTDGRKMSKSYNNFVGLAENPIDMYGKLMRITDNLIIEYFLLLTDVHSSQIAKMDKAMRAGENPMTFKKQLAFTITEQYHSTKEAEKAQQHFEDTIQNKVISDEAQQIKRAVLVGKPAFAMVSLASGASNSQSRRLIEQGGTALLPSNQRINDPNEIPDLQTVDAIRVGKRKIYKLID
ncbi:MAG: tyrosine--tRNA ligase [Candidatus Pacebacteria bacterium RIFOXYB1_FULL_39_46]|nr:MAG: tyrosine--tRNA ligase [Candidatus Pacebacteria bacterium RIFOXYA1_FULL_38_18]OGJ38534.1 MAG: tyrosine--tRNA ligase [Candidatus Pacebacteria bacterium RIFOXYB1_FULL_39_46]OGJ40394.1 MAG: tyrosine--tRNA ligase [Candidatus Pacebacteria bacterium RIFOXYC1_FULL_39_21]OGJ40513.1 MAG: tyrosine--tRNA ligase [Candidatus Pacebacteria bacterium RIFOXYD1_FULL_39_27]